MGEIAGRLADLTVVTSDNPRNESPEEIIAQIMNGVKASNGRHYSKEDVCSGLWKKGYVIEANRRKAIRLAIAASKPNDTILIAGKGHENYQIIGNDKVSFDDVLEAKLALGTEKA
jgi:UDP-N-acetylmuramyl tripeptide synthase